MSYTQAERLVRGTLEELRIEAHRLTGALKQADNSAWIGHASRKQLLAEILRLYASNHAERPF